MSFVVAIDGPAASGKGTIARAVARHFGFAHLDTGLLYRAVGKRLVEEGAAIEAHPAARAARDLRPEDLDPAALRGDAVARAASEVAAIPEVRQALMEFQRAFAARGSGPRGGAVLDGRDIGTVVCPKADVKLFIVAADEERARRRLAELRQRGDDPTYEAVLADLRARDSRDSGRAISPLKRADDAHLLDTTELSIDAAVARATEIIEQALSRAGRQ